MEEPATTKTKGKDDHGRHIRKVQRSTTQLAFRTPKPSMEIYRPPKTHQKSSPTPRVHFDTPAKTQQPAARIALKRSKSFGGVDITQLAGVDVSCFTGTQQKLINKALINPGSLELLQMLELVKILCNKAMESSSYSQPMAFLCCTIVEKDERRLFVECLANACREWFLERERLGGVPTQRRFTAYVLFLLELHLGLRPLPGLAQGPSSTLLHLLFQSCQLMASPRSLAEVECLKTVLLSAGRQMEEEDRPAMARLLESVRLGCVERGAGPQARKVLLELTELHASHWSFGPRQAIYYYPYTNNKLML